MRRVAPPGGRAQETGKIAIDERQRFLPRQIAVVSEILG